MKKQNNPFIVFRITFQETRLIDHENNYYGNIKTADAQKMAERMNLNLVCFKGSEDGELPFCKIIDYGKWKYMNEKKKKKQIKESKHATKEIRFSPVIEQHDVEHKIKQAVEFLEEGNDVIFSMRLKGRQRNFLNEANEKMTEIVNMCSEYGKEQSRKKSSSMIIVKIAKV